jgi:hypothetical protein
VWNVGPVRTGRGGAPRRSRRPMVGVLRLVPERPNPIGMSERNRSAQPRAGHAAWCWTGIGDGPSHRQSGDGAVRSCRPMVLGARGLASGHWRCCKQILPGTLAGSRTVVLYVPCHQVTWDRSRTTRSRIAVGRTRTTRVGDGIVRDAIRSITTDRRMRNPPRTSEGCRGVGRHRCANPVATLPVP